MKKFWLLRFIIVVFCSSIVIGCRTTKQRSIDVTKNEVANDRQKREMDLDSSTTTDTPVLGSNEAELATTVVNEITDNMSVLDLISNDNTADVLQETEFNKNQEMEGSDYLIPSSDEEKEDEVKSRKTRQKTYKCYCKEATYQSDCLKKCQNAQQFAKDDFAQDASAEVTEDSLEAYTNTVPLATTESVKFSNPYAKNVNFDQRVILGSAHPQSYKILSNSGINIPKNRLIPIYPQTPQLQFAITYPGSVQNGIPAIKQNYLPSALRKTVPKGTYTPSLFGKNFANIQECIKLYGQTVCVIAPTTNTPLPNSEMTTTVDFMTGNSKGKDVNKIDDSCTENNQNQKLIFLNNGQNKNLQKSFNGKYYLNKNNMNIAQAISHNNNGAGKQLNYFETLGAASTRPVTQKPVYATKYPFPTTPSYAYLDKYAKSRNHNSDEEKSYEYSTTYKNAMHENAAQNYYFEGGKETTGYPTIQFQDPKFVTIRPEYRYEADHNLLNEIHTIVGDRYMDSQERKITNYPNLLEQATISPSINKNNYKLAKANKNFAQGLSPSNTDKNRKVFVSKECNYNSDEKVTSSEINSYTSNYVEQTTEHFISKGNTLQPNSEDRDSSMITSIRKEYENDNSKPVSFNHDSQRNHQANYKNVNYYKSDSAESKDNELYYSSNEALNHENYKNNERPQPQFDYSKFPQSMIRIINEANGQYVNSKYYQYRPENILKEYPDRRVYDDNKNYYTDDPYGALTPLSPMHIDADSPNNFAKTAILKTNSPVPTSYVDRNIPIYTTISMSHTTPPSVNYNKKVEITKNQGNYYPTTSVFGGQDERLTSNYEYEDRYNNRIPLQYVNLKKQDMVEYLEPVNNEQIPNVKLNSKFESNTLASKKNSELLQYTTKSITTLENLENDAFKNYYNPIKTTTLRSADIPTVNEPIIQSTKKFPGRTNKAKIRLQMFNDTENLFRGLEKIILDNYDPVLSGENVNKPIESSVVKESSQAKQPVIEKILFGNLDEQVKQNLQKYEQVGVSEIEAKNLQVENSIVTENTVQTVDDIPATIRENIYSEFTTQATMNKTPQQTINELLVQNTVRKVINNFVPGKAEDLITNYENKNANEIVGAKVSDLLPEIVGTPVVRKLLDNPLIENMIVEVAGGLMGRIANIALSNLDGLITTSYRKVVNNEIPRSNPTLTPFTAEEHSFKNGEWVTEQVSLLGSAKADEVNSLPREVFNKIKRIFYRSELTEEEAAQPIVQNLIVKAVKHSLDKERGIVQESAIRKAYKVIVSPTKNKTLPPYDAATPSEVRKATISEPRATTESYELYKLAPVVPIAENNFDKGYWRESQNLLVDPKRKKVATDFDESAKQATQKQLDKVKMIKVTSEEDRYTEVSNINAQNSSEYEYEDENEGEGEAEGEHEGGSENKGEYDDEYSVIEGNAKEKISLSNVNDETVDIDRQPIKYYSPNDRVLEYIKTHQIGAHPSFSTTAEIIGQTNTYDTSTPMSDTKGRYSSSNFNEPEEITKAAAKQSVTNNERKLSQNNQFFGNPLREYSPQSANNLQTYMGRLIPVDEKASQAKDLNDLENSNLIYVGDGARLPLTIRKQSDGTFALTLSDVLCKQFIHKQCPCYLPGNNNGYVVREQKSIKDSSEWNISNNESESTTEKISSNVESYSNVQTQYQEKEPSEITTPAEYLDAHILPHSENLKTSEEKVKLAPSKIEKNSNTKMYPRIRRESEEEKEAVQRERFVDRESFMENHIETSMESEDKALVLNDANNEKGSQNEDNGLQIAINKSKSTETQFDYPHEESYELEVIPRMIGPYRYQQLYAKENADTLRNMFYMIQ